MEKLLLYIVTISLLGISPGHAQKNLVDWSFESHKITGNTYEVRIKATIKKGWHIYSQNPGDGPSPTTVSFTRSPLISLKGKVMEIGSLKRGHSEIFNTEIRCYESSLVLVQKIVLKRNVKALLNGYINYMVCSNTQCLAPVNKAFAIAIKS